MLTNCKTPDLFHIWHLAMTIQVDEYSAAHQSSTQASQRTEVPESKNFSYSQISGFYFHDTTQPFPYNF